MLILHCELLAIISYSHVSQVGSHNVFTHLCLLSHHAVVCEDTYFTVCLFVIFCFFVCLYGYGFLTGGKR